METSYVLGLNTNIPVLLFLWARPAASEKEIIFLIHRSHSEECCESNGVGAICENERCGLRLMPKGTSVNGTASLDILKEMLSTFMEINCCTHFQHDGAPWYLTKANKKWFDDN